VIGVSSIAHGENELDRARHALPRLPFFSEPRASRRRQRVVAGAPIVLRRVPRRADEALALEAVERGIERPLPHLEEMLRAVLEPLGDAPAMHGAELQRFQDEHVERALEQLVARFGSHSGSFRRSKGVYDLFFRSSRGTVTRERPRYSYRNASIGSSNAARRAGHTPNTTPTS